MCFTIVSIEIFSYVGMVSLFVRSGNLTLSRLVSLTHYLKHGDVFSISQLNHTIVCHPVYDLSHTNCLTLG